MTFLQPFILLGLPLILVPIVIHLLNRLRHRSMPWAAMMFLRSATRKSTRYAKLRQFLILLFRVLAVFALVMALSRPLSGGWMGWLASGAPDTIMILLDRSATMEARSVGGQSSKRQQALEVFVESVRTLAAGSRVVLVESAFQDPQEVSPPEALLDHPRTRPTDTAADLPSLIQTAADWIADNQPGSVELWLASDLQRSNWLPESERWPAVAESLAGLPQGVRVRLLALNQSWDENTGIAVRSAKRRPSADGPVLDLMLELERTESYATTVPVNITINGATSQLDVPAETTSLRFRHQVPLTEADAGGWGSVSVPADGNPSDNDSFFVYGPPVPLRAAVVAADPFVQRILRLSVAPVPGDTNRVADLIAPARAAETDWSSYALVLWQAPLPAEKSSLETYVDKGGLVVCFPSGQADAWLQPVWAELQETGEEAPFLVGRWDEQSGPLASTDEGLSLPLETLSVLRRQPVLVHENVLATFDDGQPLLARRTLGRGQMLYWATQPHPQWSRLYDGPVLVPMIQRLLEEGGQRFGAALHTECGDAVPEPPQGRWTALVPSADRQPDAQAGVFRSGEQWLAVQRPQREDDALTLPAEEARALFGDLPLQMFEEKESGPASLQSELWRTFLIFMLLFLVAEGFLILPPAARRAPLSTLTGATTTQTQSTPTLTS